MLSEATTGHAISVGGAVPAAPLVPDVDASIVARVKRGDRTAEEALYRGHVVYVAGLVGGLLRDRTETEDCVQETFSIALSRIGSLRDDEALRAWLAQIAVNLVRRRFRKRKVLSFFGLDASSAAASPEAFRWWGASPEVHADLARVCPIVDDLPTEERLAWCLRHIGGSGLEEIAAACDCSLATAKRRIASAEATLRTRLALGGMS
jgi:RNA polymerase sigma-70 factor (ECF subfamily)